MSYKTAIEGFTKCLDQIDLPKKKILTLHVRLRPVKEFTELSYLENTSLVLESLYKFEPQAMLIPAFTYSFTKSGLYHKLYSRAETGRFSEEVRMGFSNYRTTDPIFSMMDVTSWLGQQDNLNNLGAFESGCIWEKLFHEGSIVVNIGIESFVATQIHYLERLMQVPYRKTFIKSGVIYKNNTDHQTVDYTFYARDLKNLRQLNWPLIEEKLFSDGVLNKIVFNGIKFSCISVSSLHKVLKKEIIRDPYYLVRT